MTGECQATEKSFAIANTGANALATMFPKLSDGCHTRPVRRRRQHRLTQADFRGLNPAEALPRHADKPNGFVNATASGRIYPLSCHISATGDSHQSKFAP